jgi:hypothetical protein
VSTTEGPTWDDRAREHRRAEREASAFARQVERAVVVGLGLVALAAIVVAVAPPQLATDVAELGDGRLLTAAAVVVGVTGLLVLLGTPRGRGRT